MFKIFIGKERTKLTEENYKELSQLTNMYSGRDINALVQGVLNESLSHFRSTTSWKIVKPHPTNPDLEFALEPCRKSDPERQQLTIDMIREKGQVPNTILPALEMMHFRTAIDSMRASAIVEDLDEFEDWTRKFGSEGT